MKKGIIFLVASILLLALTACSPAEGPQLPEDAKHFSAEQQKVLLTSYELWIGGEKTSLGIKAADFPPVFPEVFRNIAFDKTDPKQRAIGKYLKAQTETLYYEAYLSPQKDYYHPYTESEIMSFYMVGGMPGHMEAWGVTFDMTQEEAEAAMAAYFDIEKNFPGTALPILDDRSYLIAELTDAEKDCAGIDSDSVVSMPSYRMHSNRLDLLIVDGKVRGMSLIAGMNLLAIA